MKICVIAARGGSQGVPGKNIRLLLGKPVICWAIEKALDVGIFDHVVVSTDSSAIADIAVRAGAEFIEERPGFLSGPEVGKFQVWKYCLTMCEEHYSQKCTLFVDLDCTNPLIEQSDISEAIDLFGEKRTSSVDAVFTVSPAKRNPYFNLVEPDADGALKVSKRSGDQVLARQLAPVVYEHVAGVYVLEPDYVRRATHLLDGHAEGYIVGESKSFDIDSETDFVIIEQLLKKQLGM